MVIEGRILIVWRKVFVKLKIIEESPQYVHCLVSMVGQKHRFYITFVYGLNTIEGRRSLWEGLLRLSLVNEAWIVLGDFNAPFSGMDRAGGNPISGVELMDSIRWLEVAHLVPLKSLGSFFTWTNNQSGSARIYSKIDHVFINETWFDHFPHATAVFKWEVVSDHCSCIINCQPKVSLGTKLFRFYNFWAVHPQFLEVVRFSWNLSVKATGLRALFLKSLRLKHALKKFNHNKFGDIGVRYDLAKDNYQAAQLKAQAYPLEVGVQQEVKAAAEDFLAQEKMYYSFLTQRSKVDWLQKGDQNTAFFFAFLKQRKADNGIASFVNDHGQLVDNFPEVVSHFVGHFRGYLGSRSSATGSINLDCIKVGSKLSIEQQTLLLKPFSPKEIRLALFSIPANKSPGPDGYGSGFFEAAWKIVGKEVCSAISNCFETGSFPSELHETSLSLIPKVANPFRAIDYRPIACCTTLYKCIAKLICSRLALVLPAIVQSNQGAFIRGRSIAHNIMIFQDLIKNYGRAVTSPRCAIKIDLSKAYDTGTHSAVFTLKAALDDFSSATGLTINSAKSQIFFGGVSSHVRTFISQEMNLMVGSFPLKYLGVPMRPTKWRHEDCDLILQKIRLRLNSWSSRHLSYAGRVQLIHSVLFGLRNFWMGIFVLPQSVVKEIEKLCRSFLWGSAGLRSKPHLASWKKVCLPKAYGGLGFRDGALWNRAILAKYIWALSEQPEILWVKWVNSIYLKGISFWSYTVKSDCSWYWRKLCRLKEKFGLFEIQAAGRFGKFQPSKLYNSTLNQQTVTYCSAVWCKLSLPKHRFMLWQVINEQLLTRDNLLKLHILVPVNLCPVCGCFPESHHHLFFFCCLFNQVLQLLFFWFGFSAWPSDYTSWSAWLGRPRRGLMAAILNLAAAPTVYNIWRNRNRSLFDDYSLSANCLVNEIKCVVKYRIYMVNFRKFSVPEQSFLRHLTCN
ncbi:uncharacterized protein LOC133779723 [Humulus lupulus]|uniref:uncharacterized protein LOC133779723 n=1 Tax=Humulus lupulus TaxID=3486 RepID=UPI002B4018D1|nr:uncharacterized protein LOC133779723 [Humulus lupulus]